MVLDVGTMLTCCRSATESEKTLLPKSDTCLPFRLSWITTHTGVQEAGKTENLGTRQTQPCSGLPSTPWSGLGEPCPLLQVVWFTGEALRLGTKAQNCPLSPVTLGQEEAPRMHGLRVLLFPLGHLSQGFRAKSNQASSFLTLWRLGNQG